MPSEITMPQLSDTMTEGTLVKWNKREGDKIKAGEEIADIETDKATMPMEAFDGGTLAVQLVTEGQKVKVGQILGVIATGSENPEQIKQQYASGAAASAPASKPAETTLARAEGAAQNQAPVATIEAPPVPKSDNGKRMRISPLARRMAAERNIDPATLHGSGPLGRIVKQDILAHQPPAALAIPNVTQRVGGGQKQIIPLTKMRGAIARSLQLSKQTIPHFYETIDVDVEDLSQRRARLNEILEPEKVRLSLSDFLTKAIALALQKNPALNSTFDGNEITRWGDVNLGMAVAVPDGLIVPVLRGVQSMGLKEIRVRTVDLIERARAARLKQEEMTGGTFTVSNLGTFGVREFSAIINPPQVAILAVAAAQKRAVIVGDQVVPRTMMTLTLSADHRVVDGATAAEFLKSLKELLEEPGLMLV